MVLPRSGHLLATCSLIVLAEYILHSGTEALRTLHRIFTRVLEDESARKNGTKV